MENIPSNFINFHRKSPLVKAISNQNGMIAEIVVGVIFAVVLVSSLTLLKNLKSSEDNAMRSNVASQSAAILLLELISQKFDSSELTVGEHTDPSDSSIRWRITIDATRPKLKKIEVWYGERKKTGILTQQSVYLQGYKFNDE